jgi:glutathione S-transferase
MILYARPASPFARKVRILAHETGLIDQIEEIMLATPDELITVMPEFNPLGKIPSLILNDGAVLYDSKVICEYLDSQHNGRKFFPVDPSTRWKTLMLQGLADGIAECVIVASHNKFMRPEKFVYEPAIKFQFEKITRGLASFNSKILELSELITIGPVSVACAISYLDFRFHEFGWRENNPELKAWYESFCERPSMQATSFASPSQ